MNKITAMNRGMEMMQIPMKDLPTIAVDYARFLCNKVGMCGEVLFTAWCVYAQIVEKLPCDDSLYTPDDEAIEWYKARGYDYVTGR